LNQLAELKSILQKEAQILKTNLMKNYAQERHPTDRLLYRLADHNNIIKISKGYESGEYDIHNQNGRHSYDAFVSAS
jgi:hypothetical protein